MADSVAVMRSVISSRVTTKFNPSGKVIRLGRVSSLLLPTSLVDPNVLCCWCAYLSSWELLFYASWFDVFWCLNFCVCHSLPLMCCDDRVFATNVETLSRTPFVVCSSYVSSSNVWSVLVVSASMVKLICHTLLLSSWILDLFRSLWLCSFPVEHRRKLGLPDKSNFHCHCNINMCDKHMQKTAWHAMNKKNNFVYWIQGPIRWSSS